MNDMNRELPQVLVVDDEPAIRAILSDLLVHEGFRVLTAGNGVEALEVLAERRIEIVISDMKMPEMDGLELLERIAEAYPHVVSLMITAFSTVETAIESMKRGAFDYVMKPFNVDQLMRTVHRALTQQRLKAENIELKAALSLYRLAARLGDEVELAPTLTAVVETVIEQVEADRVSVVLFEPTICDAAGAEPSLCRNALTPKGEAITQSLIVNGAAVFEYMIDHPATETVTTLLLTPLVRGERQLGVLLAVRDDARRAFTEGDRKLLTIIADRAAVAVQNAELFDTLDRTFTTTIEAFVTALEEKDRYTAGHSERVAEYARVTAQELGLSEDEVQLIYMGGRLHDIGKLTIRSAELNKPGALTDEEYNRFKAHPGYGEELMTPIPTFRRILPAIGGHHEKYDGSGYPRGLKGLEIPMMARIVAIADTYDAMTSHRAYRAALPHSIAVKELQRCSGTQFCPECVEAFLRGIETWRAEREAAGREYPR
jgi:response regulator RpfG family c-di-GMP phosphodiesterase